MLKCKIFKEINKTSIVVLKPAEVLIETEQIFFCRIQRGQQSEQDRTHG